MTNGRNGMEAPVYPIAEIQRLLPHRFPFLLVDRVLSLEVPDPAAKIGRKIRAIKNVTINEPFFPGHFAHRPVMPGVLLIEAMAQVAALACIDPTGPNMDVAIVGVDRARFRRPVVPGDRLDIMAEVMRDRASIIMVRCEARVDGHVVCEADLMAKMFLLTNHQPKSLS